MLDVRSPKEFKEGSFPGAINIPILNDDERHHVGTVYKAKGQEAALELGHSLVSGSKKAERIEQWRSFISLNPQGALYCYRGGLRSKITQEWIKEATGLDYPRISGGYKQMRRFLIDSISSVSSQSDCYIVGGKTGVGKTIWLRSVDAFVDMERFANHRGSAFGTRARPQPSQIDFENSLAIEILSKTRKSFLVFEDESRAVGSVHVPFELHAHLKKSPLIVMTAPLEERVKITLDSYILETLNEYTQLHGEGGHELWISYLLRSLEKISKKLGLEFYGELRSLMLNAIDRHRSIGDIGGHSEWIRLLLTRYYDPMYEYQLNLSAQAGRVIFEGPKDDVINFLEDIKSKRAKETR